jgi:LmbE family N-acetylglucosaminyl deacetylase
MKRVAPFFIAILGFISTSFSQSQPTWTSAEMYQAMRKLNVLGTVLYVAAHPDDENTRLIAFLSKDKLYRTGYLSLTRGDGGQNLIGNEQGIDLGLIRTQELLAARRIDGGEQFFTRAYDFGYSKTPQETLTKWDKEKILSDVVWIIRKFQPDVVITRFPTTGEGGHGHHTASAILANEAYEAAADPQRFPEQLNKVGTWKVKRVLLNGFNFGNVNLTSPDQFKFDVGGYNPLLGKSYGEIAAESRSQHKSQGFGVPAGRGEALEYFKTTKGEAPVTDLMDGVDLSWSRVKGGEEIGKMVDNLIASFDFLKPDRSVPELVRLHKALSSLENGYWKNQKINEVRELIIQCSGLFVDATASEQFAVQTDSVRINFTFNNRLGVDASLQYIKVDAFDSTLSRTLDRNKNINFSKTLFVPSTKPITQPYWLANKMAEGYFNVNNQVQIGQPDVDPSFVAIIVLNIHGERLALTRPVKYRFTDPVRGEVYWPLVVMPPYTLKVDPEMVIWSSLEKTSEYVAHYQKRYSSYKSNNPVLSGFELKKGIDPGEGFKVIDSFRMAKGGSMEISIEEKIKADTVAISHGVQNGTNGYKELLPNLERQFIDKTTRANLFDVVSIEHDHVPAITYFKDARTDIRWIPFRTYGKKVAYIVGAGDKVPEALEQMGYEVNMLTEKELSRNSLDKFDAIITGVRAYNTNDWLNKYYDKLMKYVNDGGNLIVQYNTSNNIGPVRAKISPYNLNITRTRITDENSSVTLLNPEHPAFNFPNKITQDDFKGWIQERSIYHGSDTTGKFEKLLSMNDPGEKQEDGALLVAKYGKGYFTYTGLVFFRELPAGVPGAYRLLANLIALNRRKAF